MLTTLLIAMITSGNANAYDGACCLDDGSCIEAVDRECADIDGTYMGDYTTCSDEIECPVVTDEPETGACCIDDTCWELTEEECADREGGWSGIGSECEPDMTCPGDDTTDTGTDEELGACCVDDTCIDDVSYNDCKLDLGDWYAGMDCADVESECRVEEDTGACCVDDVCYENTMDECRDMGGYFYGVGSDCTDAFVECEVEDEIGACCLDDECIETTAEECWAEEGAFYGPDSSCDDSFVECCGDDTSTEPTGPSVSLSCNSSGQNRGNLGLLLPLGLLLMLAGFRREEGVRA